ncbi:hypothetical protein NSQ92_10055 [Niallia sp. FSL M8-0099]|uniref:hypothetical protein n=1 Tax=Niallia sp. FSL M8-0099 TaxID=2954519 RepID=UPI0030F642DB
MSYNTWCPTCTNRFSNEAKCKYILEQLTGEIFIKTRTTLGTYKDNNTYLELDMYNEKLKLALEYNGEQHYRQIEYFYHDEESFIELQKRDELKIRLCEERGIKLIIVKYDIRTDEEKINYITQQLLEKNVQIKNKNISMKGYYI